MARPIHTTLGRTVLKALGAISEARTAATDEDVLEHATAAARYLRRATRRSEPGWDTATLELGRLCRSHPALVDYSADDLVRAASIMSGLSN